MSTAVAKEATRTLLLDMVFTARSATKTINPSPTRHRLIQRLIPRPGYNHLKNCILNHSELALMCGAIRINAFGLLRGESIQKPRPECCNASGAHRNRYHEATVKSGRALLNAARKFLSEQPTERKYKPVLRPTPQN